MFLDLWVHLMTNVSKNKSVFMFLLINQLTIAWLYAYISSQMWFHFWLFYASFVVPSPPSWKPHILLWNLYVWTVITHSEWRCLLTGGDILPVVLLHVTWSSTPTQGVMWARSALSASSQKAYVRRVSAAENPSEGSVSDGQILCLPNPSDKTHVRISVTQTFM